MKKVIFKIALLSAISVAINTGCSTPEQKIEASATEVVEAKEDLSEAYQAYLLDVAEYKKLKTVQLTENEKNIADFKARVALEKKAVKDDYLKKVEELEKRNNAIKIRMEEYQIEGQDKWENFKKEFNRDLDELGKSLKDFTNDNNKK